MMIPVTGRTKRKKRKDCMSISYPRSFLEELLGIVNLGKNRELFEERGERQEELAYA